MVNQHEDPLQQYRAKRATERTPEPAGVVSGEPGRLYVMQKHAATRMHWDLRLELGGTLKSWAVPKGPSYDQADKRLAVQVEDHPIEYADFEGIIPEGNYGAGAVIVWDRGTWEPVEDPVAGLEKGKLLFELHGHKLKGRWTLVKIKKSEKDWLLIKERDGLMTPGGREVPEESVLSGRTVEELRDGRDLAGPIRAELERLKVPKRVVRVDDVDIMLAESVEEPFTRDGWLFELKLDGYRILAELTEGRVRLVTRRGNEANGSFPEIVRAVAALPYRHIIIDGEVVATDDQGRPSFQRLQQRARFLRPTEIRRATLENPVSFYAFDFLAFEDRDLRGLPLTERKRLLRELLPPAGQVHYVDHFEREGERLFGEVSKLGLEGIVAKRADAVYQGGRSPHWLKMRVDQSDDFVVVGYTEPKGSRTGLGALHLADYVDGVLTYAGRAGSGFKERELADLRQELEQKRRPTPPCVGPLPTGADTCWVEPELVCEVRYKEFTDEELLRQPVFLRFRDDKKPEECVRRNPEQLEELVEEAPAPVAASVGSERKLQLSNLEKIFWPEDGYTKGDLVEYYRAISPWLLPYLRERPVVLTRYPDGIAGKSFFQKDAPGFAPEWLRTVKIWSEETEREIDYFVADNEAALVYLANSASIPLHIWLSSVGTLERPDWCVIDLDPKGAPFTDVVQVALTLHQLCEEVGLPNFAKTSGSTGIHVLVPVGRLLTYEQSRSFGELLSQIVVSRASAISTVVRAIQRRDGKVYLDYVQNGYGRLLVAPFSVRPLPGAPVSMPVSWEEVTPELDPKGFTIKTAVERMQRKGDPMAPLREVGVDLMEVLQKLERIQRK
ncbi:MAG TPA: DNA ligase D [Gemmatimonadales bacterium]|nr:DNA ligase D [Gemmatimonadales bacterium]